MTMRNSRSIAGVAITTLILAGLGVAGATSASAQDDGPLQVGNIYLFNNNKNLATATPADQVTGQTSFTGRPFTTVAVDASCPADTAQAQLVTRLKSAAAEVNWDEVPMGASRPYTQDANGHAYITTSMDNFSLSSIQNFLGGTTKVLPLAVVCMDAGANTLGYFSTDVSIAPLASPGWSLVSPVSVPKPATTTTLGSLPASVEQGTAVSLSATVAPAGATGSIEYFDGTTSLGVSAIGTPLSVSSLAIATHAITAHYLGDASYSPSTSAAGSITVTQVAPRSTTTTLGVDVVAGAPYQTVTLTANVAASTGIATGSIAFKDNGVLIATSPLDAAGKAVLANNTFGAGAHSFTAEYAGNAPYTASASTAVTATYVAVGASDAQTVTVAIPAGTISITTPYTPTAPLALGTAVLDSASSTYSASAKFGDATDQTKAIKITDTRAGNLGFTAKVQSGDFTNGTSTFGGKYAGLTGVRAVQLTGNALLATDITPTDHVAFTDGLGTAKTFAVYPAGKATGTALLDGTFGVDKVPSSVTPGTYTATLVFTAN